MPVAVDTAGELLRLAATAWATEQYELAERLVAAAADLVAGLEDHLADEASS